MFFELMGVECYRITNEEINEWRGLLEWLIKGLGIPKPFIKIIGRIYTGDSSTKLVSQCFKTYLETV